MPRKRRRSPRPPNPRFDRSLPRSGRLPLTLVDSSTRALTARDLRAIAAAIHPWRPCYAQLLMRVARQVEDTYTAAQAVANYTEKPVNNTAHTEGAFASAAFAEGAFTEAVFSDVLSGES